jgi:transcriptional regulator GlxA family with amidase domain
MVHAAILRVRGGRMRIADLARQAGFTEPGRFAALYRATFDETPSTTLRRAREA